MFEQTPQTRSVAREHGSRDHPDPTEPPLASVSDGGRHRDRMQVAAVPLGGYAMQDQYRRFASEGFVPLDSVAHAHHPPGAVAVVMSRPDRLPLESLPWERFQLLVADLVKKAPGVRQSFVYGRPSQPQQGVDVVAILESTPRVMVLQCRRVQALKDLKMGAWARQIVDCHDPAELESVILATSLWADDDARLVDTWRKCDQDLRAAGIHAKLWHGGELCSALRNHPEIVERHFGPEIARTYCSSVLSMRTYPETFADGIVNRFENHARIEKRSVAFSLFVADDRNVSVSGCFSFARSDLRGATFTAAGRALVRWLQWRAHSLTFEDCPFVLSAVREGDPSLLVTPSTMLALEPWEHEDLLWVLEKAWETYALAAEAFEEKWRALRFARCEPDVERLAFEMAIVDRAVWKAVEVFAAEDRQEDRQRQGPGDPTEAHLRDDLRRLLRGRLAARVEDSGGRMVLIWCPPSRSDSVDERSSEAWNPEMVHTWLMDELFPVVRNRRGRAAQSKPRSALARWMHPASAATHEVPGLDGGDVRSLAGPGYRANGLHFVSTDEARQITSILQAHFSPYASSVPLEARLCVGVLNALCHVIGRSGRPTRHDPYIRSNLGLQEGDLVAGVVALSQRWSTRTQCNPFWLDLCLRSLAAALEVAALRELELVRVAEGLAPVWQRYMEDRMCVAYV